jgi:hypothetical protein
LFLKKNQKDFTQHKKKEKITTRPGPRAETPFHFDKVTENTSLF